MAQQNPPRKGSLASIGGLTNNLHNHQHHHQHQHGGMGGGVGDSKNGGCFVAASVEQVRVENGPEHVDAALLTTFDQMLHVVKQGNAKLLAQLLQRTRPKFDLSRLDEDFQTCLHHAARYDRPEALQVLLLKSLSLDVNVRGADGWTPLHTAARFASIGCLRLLLQRRDLQVDAATDMGLTALHFAAKYSNSDVAMLLLDHGAQVAARDNEGRLPIVYAVKNSNPDICALLCSRGSPIDAKDNGGKTPFVSACHLGDSQMMQFLIGLVPGASRRGQQMLTEPDFEGKTPLHHAVLSGSQEAVGMLLATRVVSLNAFSASRQTPIFLACLIGSYSIVRLLANAGADVNLTDHQGMSPLHVAAQKQRLDLAELLLDLGADPTVQDAEFRTALHTACQRSSAGQQQQQQLAIIRAIATRRAGSLCSRDGAMRTCLHLLAARPQAVEAFRQLAGEFAEHEFRAAINLGDWHSESVLHAAVRADNAELIQLLMQWEPDIDMLSTEDMSPAELAARLGRLECGRLLLEPSGIPLAKPLVQRAVNAAFLCAAQSGHCEFVDYLLGGGFHVDLNWTDQYGCSALMFAVSGGHAAIAARLIESGCDVNLQDKSQNTALHYAAKEDRTGSCVQLLVDNGATMLENCTCEVPLDLAATSNNEAAIEIFLAPDNFEDFKKYRRCNGQTLFDVLIEHAPKHAMKVLDNCIIKSKCGVLDKDFSVTLDFQALDPGPYDPSASESGFYWATKTMANNMHEDLLTHPVTAVLTLYKWRTFGRFYFLIDIVFYLLFMAANTAFIVDQKPPKPSNLNPETGCLNDTLGGERRQLERNQLIFEKYLVFVFACCRLALEVAKLSFKRQRYFLDLESYFYLALVGTTLAFMWPPSYEPCMYNWACGVISITLTWCIFLFQMQNLPYAGIYALMFKDVTRTLVKALSVFVFLLMGFSMAFYISNHSMDPFKTFDRAFMKTFDMTLGEFDYNSYFESIKGIFREYSQAVFVVFAIVMSLALINLLVGLAVGDIDSIQRNSSTKLIVNRVELLCEKQSIFPRWLRKRWHRNTLQLYPNKRHKGRLLRWLFTNAYAQEYLKAELKQICRRQEAQGS